MPRNYKIIVTIIGTVVVSGFIISYLDRDIYVDKGTFYELNIMHDLKQGERVEIAKDKPKFTMRGWNNEYAISVIPQFPNQPLGVAQDIQGVRSTSTKRMEYKSGDITAFIEPKEGGGNEFDIDFTLDSKPDTNIFTYIIEGAEEFDFFYQPELTPEEIAKGAFRPENVIGSYAVYHKTKRNHKTGETNYATGKVTHIYRPKAIDANGQEVWAVLDYQNEVLSVTVPQEFLDTAIYPVRVDPTFGYTSVGATGGSTMCQNFVGIGVNDSGTVGTGYNLSEAGTLDSLHIAVKSVNGAATIDMFAALYREDTVADSHPLVASVERLGVGINTTGTFYTFTAASETLTTDDYIVAGVCDGNELAFDGVVVLLDSGSNHNLYDELNSGAGAYATRKAENPWTETDSVVTSIYSLYATYSVTGSGGSVGIPNIKYGTTASTDTYAGWYSTAAYTYRKKITIPFTKVSGGSNLSNFPVLISTTDADFRTTANGGKAASGSGEFVITSSNGTTVLPHEIETYSATTGQFIGWVNVTTLSATADTYLYMYYGGPSSGATNQNRTGVWDANYQGVWHLNETVTDEATTGTHIDSAGIVNGTQNNNDDTTGKIAKGQIFDNTSDYINMGNNVDIERSSQMTFSLWVKHTSDIPSEPDEVFSKVNASIFGYRLGMRGDQVGDPYEFELRGSNGTILSLRFNNSTLSSFHYLVVTYDGSSTIAGTTPYIDGATVSKTSAQDDLSANITNTGSLNLAAFNSGASSYFDGSIDEFRISTTARSAGWIATEYNNQSSPSTFAGFGGQQTQTISEPLIKIRGGVQFR